MTEPTTAPEWIDASDRMAAVAAAVEQHLDAGAVHGLDHGWRTFALGTKIADAEGADGETVGAAALVHDLHWGATEETYVEPEETLPTVRSVLDEAAFPPEKVEAVCHCVAVHDEYPFEPDPKPAGTLEAKALQDADNLDAIGAVGVARVFAYVGRRETPLYVPESDGPAVPDALDGAGTYEPAEDWSSGSGIGNCHRKLLRLRDAMNTETGREIAQKRHDYLVDFLDRFGREWRGEA